MGSVWDVPSLWLEAQSAPAAREVARKLRQLRAENAALAERCEHMSRGFPDGVTVEEWEIIKELREAAPPPERPSKEEP